MREEKMEKKKKMIKIIKNLPIRARVSSRGFPSAQIFGVTIATRNTISRLPVKIHNRNERKKQNENRYP